VSFAVTRSLETTIRHYIDIHNEEPKPFIWTNPLTRFSIASPDLSANFRDTTLETFLAAALFSSNPVDELIGLRVEWPPDHQPSSPGLAGVGIASEGRLAGGRRCCLQRFELPSNAEDTPSPLLHLQELEDSVQIVAGSSTFTTSFVYNRSKMI